MEASEPKWYNPVLNVIMVNSLRLGGLHLYVSMNFLKLKKLPLKYKLSPVTKRKFTVNCFFFILKWQFKIYHSFHFVILQWKELNSVYLFFILVKNKIWVSFFNGGIMYLILSIRKFICWKYQLLCYRLRDNWRPPTLSELTPY